VAVEGDGIAEVVEDGVRLTPAADATTITVRLLG
jgi:hypothetical protein